MGGDPRGAAVLRDLRGAEALQGFPTLLHFALPLLFAEGIRLVLLCAEALQDFPAFLQFAPPLRNLLFAEVKRVAGVRGVRRGWGGGPIPPRGRVVGLAQEPQLPAIQIPAQTKRKVEKTLHVRTCCGQETNTDDL